MGMNLQNIPLKSNIADDGNNVKTPAQNSPKGISSTLFR